MIADRHYKVTRANGACVYGRGVWKPGRWRTVSPPLKACSRGIHYCRRDDLVSWLNAELWLFEDGAPETAIDGGDKMVTTKGRVVERVETWNDKTARLFAADCAEAVVHLIPESHREPFIHAINTARLYAHGEIDVAARDAARVAAWAAAGTARDATGAAARADAWAAARAAAWAAARAAAGAAGAARDATGAAARAAAGAARDAAWAAAGAARDATGAAAGAAAGAAQTKLLLGYLDAAT